ncbi:MAG TPA: NADH-quinone oxidoreductase subunit N [Candidatus Eisenbacteria bacterium]|nr:NADH-quinone oxidoreductase subunit N [Candidatus Eisenbacteria bacterium]
MMDLGVNWSAVLPHLILCGMGSLILVGAAGRTSVRWALWAAVIGVVAAMVAAWMMQPGPPAFSGAVAVDGVSRILYVVLALSALLTLFFTAGYGGRWEVESGEYYALVLFATAGMMALAGGLDLVTIFIGLEVASISQYVLAAFRWHEVRSTEASVKYLLLGAFASGFLVYGISLIYGATGTTNLHEIAAAISSQGLTQSPLLLAGLGLLLVGLGFKMSAVPFHMWTPDVYQGAPTVVTAFMASGPKVAVVAALFRILFTGFDASRAEWGAILWWLAVLTMVVGNVLALVQRDMKRLLAYSAIAHAGYLLVALLAGEELGGIGTLYYLVVYTLTTLGAFGVVALVRNEDDGGTAIDKFSGLGFSRPWLGAAMAIFMFSLAGIPPAAGFVGKFYIFAGAVQAGQVPLAVIGVLASLVSVYYYLRVVVVMYMRPTAPGESAFIPAHAAVRLALLIAVGGILVLGVYPGPLYAAARAAVQGMAG